MKYTTHLLLQHTKNGILSIKRLQKRNLYLLRLLENNFAKLKSELEEQGVFILNDYKIQSVEDIQAFLLYHYGTTVNLSTLKKKDPYLYWILVRLGKPQEIVEQLGFEVVYKHKMTESQILKQIQERADERGNIKELGYELHYRVRYLAERKGMSISDYLESLGYRYRKVDYEYVKYLREVEKLTFPEIGKILGVADTTARAYYQKVKPKPRFLPRPQEEESDD